MKLKTYDIERTICDIIKNRNKIDKEIFSKALKRYANLQTKDLNKLVSYAKQLKVLPKVLEYFQILL